MRMFHRIFAASAEDQDDAPGAGERKHFRRRAHGCGNPCCETSSESSRPDAKPLTAFRGGDKVVVDRIQRGRMACRLYAMGLTPGTPLTIESPGPGAVRFIVRGSSIALGRGQAEKVFCIPLEKAEHSGSGSSDISEESSQQQEQARSSQEKSIIAQPFLRLKGLVS